MPGQHLPAGIDLGAGRLDHAQDDAAGQRPPQAAEAADDHRLEPVDQPVRPDRRVEIAPHRQEHAGDGDHRERQRHRQPEDVAGVQAHQPRHRRVVRDGPEGAAERRAVEQQLQPADHHHGHGELRQRQDADAEPVGDPPRGHLDRPRLQPAAVRREQHQQPILDDDGQAERHQQRRQQVAPERAVQQQALRGVADRRHDRHDQHERGERVQPQAARHHQRDIGRQHHEVAMRDVDQPHHAEDQRQAGREQAIETADQHALHDGVDPIHRPHTPK